MAIYFIYEYKTHKNAKIIHIENIFSLKIYRYSHLYAVGCMIDSAATFNIEKRGHHTSCQQKIMYDKIYVVSCE